MARFTFKDFKKTIDFLEASKERDYSFRFQNDAFFIEIRAFQLKTPLLTHFVANYDFNLTTYIDGDDKVYRFNIIKKR